MTRLVTNGHTNGDNVRVTAYLGGMTWHTAQTNHSTHHR